MKTESKIGPMGLFKIKRTMIIDSHSIILYRIQFEDSELVVTALHAFKVIRDGKETYLPASMLEKDDSIWVDQSAFVADGSLKIMTFKNKRKTNNEDVPRNNRVSCY